MQLPVAVRFVGRSSGRIAPGSIAMMTDEAVAAWMRWRYGLEDEDRAWDWWNIWTDARESRGVQECYAAWAEEDLQGLMALDLKGRSTRQERLVMVDYLSTNPANRFAQTGIKHVGTALMALAIARSDELGFGGRIGLEALRGAETFYEGLGMTRQAHLSREGNAVYIFEPEAAEELLENVREKGILQL